MTPLLAVALAVAPGCGPALAEAGTLSPEELADRAPALVERLAAEGAGGPVIALERAARALASGATAIDRRGAGARSFRGALVRHCALASAPAVPGASARDRGELAAILARPEVVRARSDPYAVRRTLLALRDRLLDLLGTSEAERYASLGRALFLAAAAAAGALALAALRRRRRGGTTGPRAPAAAALPATLPAEGPDASAARAEEALRRGDAREAVRQAFLAALGALERAGGVPRGRTLTNGEIVASLRRTATATPTPTPTPTPTSTSTAAHDFAALAAAFDRAVYGGLPVDVEDARTALARARRVGAAGARP